MNYITALNQLLASETKKIPQAVLYGENINCGSFICGMTRSLEAHHASRLINVGNCELTHCGVGFGMMLNGATAILFVKQLDFMLLGADQFVSTYHSIRCQQNLKLGSFNIVTIVCDHGYQGPQSSFNAMGDLCSMARVSGYTLTNLKEAEMVLRSQLTQPGFRFIGLSQRLFPTECLDLSVSYAEKDGSLFQYGQGDGATIVCFNFSLPEGYQLQQRLLKKGISAELFSVHHTLPHRWDWAYESIQKTSKVVILDDAKGSNLLGYKFAAMVADRYPQARRVLVTRNDEIDFHVAEDQMKVDYDSILKKLC